MPAAVRLLKNVQVAREIGANVAITSSSTAELLTTAAHGMTVGSSGQLIKIAGHTGSTPDINGTHFVGSVPTSTTFTIVGVDITVGGTGGTLNVLQTGVTPGAAATWRRLVGKITWQRIQEMEEFEGLDVGLYVDSLTSIIVGQAVEFTWEFPLDTNQLLLPLLSGAVGDVAGVGGGADKTWTFTPPTAGPAKVDSYTWEGSENDGAVHIITRSNFVVCTGFTITINDTGVPMVSAKFLGRAPIEATAFTATTPGAQPAIDGKHIPARLFKAYRDATAAGFGTTQLALGQLYGAQYTFGPFINPDFFLDGRTSMDHSKLVSQRRKTELMMDVVVDALSSAFVATEQANKTAGTKSFIELEGIRVSGGVNHKLEIQIVGKHAPDSLAERGNDRNGNLNTRAHFKNQYDSVGAVADKLVVVTDIAAFP